MPAPGKSSWVKKVQNSSPQGPPELRMICQVFQNVNIHELLPFVFELLNQDFVVNINFEFCFHRIDKFNSHQLPEPYGSRRTEQELIKYIYYAYEFKQAYTSCMKKTHEYSNICKKRCTRTQPKQKLFYWITSQPC